MTATTDPFQTRDEVVAFIEEQAMAAVAKAARPAPDRRLPWVTAGPVGQDSAGYSVLKAAAYALGFAPAEQCKEELHTHRQLSDLYAGYGFLPHHGAQSFLVPLASAHLPAFEPHGRRVQQEVRQKLLAHAGRFDPDEADWLNRRLHRKALSAGEPTEGGSLARLPVLGELIDLQRSLEAFAAAGASEIALPPGGRVQLPKLTGASTAYWVGENAAITTSQPATGSLDLVAKKLGVLVTLTNELLRFASPSAEGLVRFDMARAAALKADKAMLEGTGGTQIAGLLNTAGVTTHVARTVGANGNTFQPEDVALMEAALPDAVDGPTAWVMRKGLFAALMNRRTDAVTAGDGKGPFVFRPDRGAADGPPATLFGSRVVRSAQVSAARVKGTGNNLTYAVCGQFADWVTARLGVMEFLASGHGDTALANDLTYLRGIQHLDAGARHPGSFVVCDTLVVG
jgi:HK97 family phage major capsid protein